MELTLLPMPDSKKENQHQNQGHILVANPWYDLSLSFLTPFCNLGIDLIPQLWFYLACVPCK